MKKPERKDGQDSSMIMGAQNHSISRILILSAIVIYTITLVLIGNLAWADESKDLRGALIKVNGQLDGNAFNRLNPNVKSVNGNILAIDINGSSFVQLEAVGGVCASQLDHVKRASSQADFSSSIKQYSGAQAIVGILDNTGTLNSAGLGQLKKIESGANVGFISYLSDDPNSTVIIRNLRTGESNLVLAMAYMQEYARTVNRPLVIEIISDGAEMSNPLFVQVCQKMAETGTQFIGASGISSSRAKEIVPIQMAFAMFNTKSGKMTDRSDFWAITEVSNQEILLLGSDESTCMVQFQKEAGFDKIYLSNSSDDIVIVTTLGANGEVNYYHVKNKETALIPRELMNGTPVLEDGLEGVYPFHSKKALFNGADSENQFVDLNDGNATFEHTDGTGMAISLAAPVSRTLTMTLGNLEEKLRIQIKDASGNVVYNNQPDASAQRIQTRIDLSQGNVGIYYLDLCSAQAHRVFALMMN